MPSSYAVKHKERAEQLQRLKARAGAGRRSGDTALSAVLAAVPSSYDGRKIAVVDKNVAALDALPDRYASVKTLYVSKNALRSLVGIEQFQELKALSAADNAIADLDALRLLPAAGIALEAASFEGNPIADLPNYRAHVIHILGPSLAMLDNRAVTAEERAAAAGAVAHEATMLALMLSNACLVHKLGRCVQLVKLHCELQRAVLGGQCGGIGGGGGDAADAVLPSGRCINRVLQMWDYEGSLGRQERHAIGLAIRREVGRRYRKIVLAGGKPEGSTKLWQQAFAQVMLLQQETVASLMKLLEDAKAEAAAVLAPLLRTASPTKRRALESEREAQSRVRQDREALIQELRDAFLGLADASAHTNAPQRAAAFEARIRELHAALEAAGDSMPTTVHARKQSQEGERQAGSPGQWAIPAMRATAAAEPATSPAASPQRQRPGLGRLKSALKQPQPAGSGISWSPARPGTRQAVEPDLPQSDCSEASNMDEPPAERPGSAYPGHSSAASVAGSRMAVARPCTAPASRRKEEPADQRQRQQRQLNKKLPQLPPPQQQQEQRERELEGRQRQQCPPKQQDWQQPQQQPQQQWGQEDRQWQQPPPPRQQGQWQEEQPQGQWSQEQLHGQGQWQQKQQQQQQWQADDGLAEYEGMEQARCKTPRPFQTSVDQPGGGGRQACASSLHPMQMQGSSHPRHDAARQALPAGHAACQQQLMLPSQPLQQQQQQQPADAAHQQDCSSQLPHAPHAPWNGQLRPGSPAGSPLASRPTSPGRSRPGSASAQWVPNPLARHSNTGTTGASCPESPGQLCGLQGVFRLLEREGRLNQIEALKSAIAQYEMTAAELQASNHALSGALEAAQRRAQGAEAELSEQAGEAEEAQQRQAEQLEELGAKLQAVLLSRGALQAQLEAAAAGQQSLQAQLGAAVAERQALQAQFEVMAAERQAQSEQARTEQQAMAAEAQRMQQAACAREQQLLARIEELEARRAVELTLAVTHEAEWRAEAARAAALEAQAGELQACLAAYQRLERRDVACAQLARRAILRRAVLLWRVAAAVQAYLGAMTQQVVALHRRRLLAAWLSNWRLATQRSKVLQAREEQRQRRRLHLAWQSWRLFCQDCVLRRGLEAAARLHRQSALLQQSFSAWAQHAAACCQVELPPEHPTVCAAAQLQRRCLLRTCLAAWRRYMQEHVLPRMAQVQLRMLEQFMGSQRRAWAAWQLYVQHRQQHRMLQATAQHHYLRHLLSHWRQAAEESKEERAAALRGAVTNQMLLLRRGWRAWGLAVQQKRQQELGLAVAVQHHRHKVLAACWQGWDKWVLLSRGVKERHTARLQVVALGAWRQATQTAENKRLADALHHRWCHLRFRASLCAWRNVVAACRQRRHQAAHTAALLRRRLLGRIVAGWRRAALAGRLCHALGLVHELQGAVERVREELQHKALQIQSLQSVQVTVEGQSESLSLQVRSLDADLQAAQQQAADLQAAAQAAQAEHQAALAAMQQAVEEAAAAAAQRDAAIASSQRAEVDRAAACSSRKAAEAAAEEALERAEAAEKAAAGAMAQAAAAAAALEALTAEHQAAQAQVGQLQEERAGLVQDLEQALAEAQRCAVSMERLQQERDRLVRHREDAEARCAAAATEQGAALKQAERLAQLCEEREQQCRQLHAQVAQLQGMLTSQAALQEELAQLAERNQQLHTESQHLQGQLDGTAAALEQAESQRDSLQQVAEALRADQQRLQAQMDEHVEEVRHLARLAETLHGAKSALERQLAAAQDEAAQAASDRSQLAAEGEALRGERDMLAAAGDELRGERDELAATAAQLREDKAGLEAAVQRLREQLQQSNGVLESCRQMLGECCAARSAADQAASLTELLRGVKGELLLKDASIKALARENAQRAERLQRLQAQVGSLSEQVRSGGAAPGHIAEGASGSSSGAGSSGLHGQIEGAASMAAAVAAPAPGTAALAPPIHTLSPVAGPRVAAATSFGTPAPGLPYMSLRLDAVAPSSSGSRSSGANLTPTSYAAPAQQQPQHQQFSFASPTGSSPAPSYIPASPQQGSGSYSSTVSAKLPAPVPVPVPSSASRAAGTPANAAFADRPPTSLSQLLPLRSLSPSGAAGRSGASTPVPASLSPELSDRRLSCLLEMVVEKRISAAQAQQVINAAAEGDARPLLHTLGQVKPWAEPQTIPRSTSLGPPLARPIAPAELASVRRQIAELQHRHC